MSERICPRCGTDMTGRRPNAVYCSRLCKDRHRHEAERAEQERSEAFWAAIGRIPRSGSHRSPERAQRRFLCAEGRRK